MAITIDSGFPYTSDSGSGVATTFDSATFSTSAASVIVVCVGSNASGFLRESADSVVIDPDGAALSCTRAVRAPTGSAWDIRDEIWYYVSSGALTSVDVRVTYPGDMNYTTIAVFSLSGVNTSDPLGATAYQSSTSSGTAKAISITPEASGNLVVGSFKDRGSTTDPTELSGTTQRWNSGTYINEYVVTYETSGTSSVSVGSSAPTTGTAWIGVLAEINAAASGTTYTGTNSESATASDALDVRGPWHHTQAESAAASDRYAESLVRVPVFGAGGGASAAATFTCAFPTRIEAGDLLLLACYTRSNASTWTCFTIPASFTGTVKAATATANGSYAVFWKRADGTETGNLTVTGSTSNNTEVAKIVCIPNTHGPSFIQGAAETEAAGLTFTNAGVTPTSNGSYVVRVDGFQDHGTTGDTGFSNWTGGTNLGTWYGGAYGTTSGTDGTIGIGCALQGTAAATGNISVDHTDETNDAGISYSFAVGPNGFVLESATATDAYDAGISAETSPYSRTQAESATATDSLQEQGNFRTNWAAESTTATDPQDVGKIVRGQGQNESATATDSQAFVRVIPDQGQSESATATDTAVVTRVLRAEAQSEPSTATDDYLSALVGAATTYNEGEAESATAMDSVVDARVLRSQAQAESATATDVVADARAVRHQAQSESATATDAVADSRAVRGQGQAESATATDTVEARAAWASAQSESVTATDEVQALGAFVAAQAESATATDTVSGLQGFVAEQSEIATATDLYDDALSAPGVYTDSQAETATATEAWGVSQVYACTLAEAVTAADAYAEVLPTTYNEGLAETATASDLYSGTTIAILQQRLRLWNGSSWV